MQVIKRKQKLLNRNWRTHETSKAKKKREHLNTENLSEKNVYFIVLEKIYGCR